MRAGRPAEQNDVEFLPLLNKNRQLGGGRYIGDPPTPRLVSERQFETVAAQPTLIDDREMTPGRADIEARWKTRLVFNGLIEHGRSRYARNTYPYNLLARR